MANRPRVLVFLGSLLLSVTAGLAAPVAPSSDTSARAAGTVAAAESPVVLPPLVSADTPQFGSIPGSFAVNDVGNATYRVPIDLPPGPNDMAPDLAVSYDSAGGNGLLGMGFSLSGLPAISVCREQRRNVDFRRMPLCLDGERLLPDSAADSFHTEHFSQRRIKRVTSAGDPANVYFEVTDPDGTVHRYGDPGDSRYRRAFTLPLTRSTDRFGNRIRYDWIGQETAPGTSTPYQLLPGTIYYGHQEQIKVTFDYESRPTDRNGGFFLGRLDRADNRLKKITVWRRAPTDTQHKRASAYTFSYGSNDQPTRLKQIGHCGTDDTSCNLPTQFTFSLATPYTYTLTPAYEQTVQLPGYEYDADHRAWLHDANGDGIDDVVVSAGSIGKGWYLLPSRGKEGLGNDRHKLFDRSIKVADATPTEVGGGLALDYDGNGTVDILPFQSDGNLNPLLFDKNNGAQRVSIPYEFKNLLVSARPDQTPAFDYNALVAGDFTGDKVVDLMTYRYLGTSIGNDNNPPTAEAYYAQIESAWMRADGKKNGGFELPYAFNNQILREYTSHYTQPPPWTPQTLTHARRVMAINYDNGSPTSLLFNRNVCNKPSPNSPGHCFAEPDLDPFRGNGSTTYFYSDTHAWSDQLMSRGFEEFTVDPSPCTGCLDKPDISGAAPNDVITFSTEIPANAKNLSVSIEGRAPQYNFPPIPESQPYYDSDLYVRRGAAPTTTNYDCRPHLSPVYDYSYTSGTYKVQDKQKEACLVDAPAAGTWYVQVRPSVNPSFPNSVAGVVSHLTLRLTYTIGGFDFTAQRPVRWSKFPSANTQAGEFPTLDLSSRVIKQGDFNGDGQMDLVVDSPVDGGTTAAGAKKKLWIWYNTGHELWDGSDITADEGYSQRFLKPIYVNYTPSSQHAFEHALVADMDGDGRQELVIPSRSSVAQGDPDPDTVDQLDVVEFPRSPKDIIGFQSVGTLAASVAPFSRRTLNDAATGGSNIYSRSPALIGDVNGDLRPDVVVTDVDNISNSHLKVYFGNSIGAPSALLTEIREGPNNVTSSFDAPATHAITYASPNDTGTVLKYLNCENAPDNVCGAPANYVVKQIVHDTDSLSGAPRTETHSYVAGRIDRASGRFLGFATHSVKAEPVDGYETTYKHRRVSNTLVEDDPRLLSEEVRRDLPDGQLHYTRTTNAWDIATTLIGTGAAAYVKTRTVEQFEGSAILLSLGQLSPYLTMTEEVKSLDSYGNITQTRQADSQGFYRYTTVSPDVDLDAWLLQRIKRVVVLDSSPQTLPSSETRTTEYTYAKTVSGAPTAAVNSVTRFGSEQAPGLRNQVEVTSRDVFGNPLCTTVRDLATQATRDGGCVYYDLSNGVYPYKTVDALGLATFTYFDSLLGLPMVTIAPTGRRAEVQYDKLGRPVHYTGDGMLGSTTKYGYEKQSNSEMLAQVRTYMLGFAVNESVLDRLGRPRFQRFRGFDGGTRESRSSYDAHGHLVARGVPEPKTTPPYDYYKTTYAYDNVGRILSASFPGKGTTTYSYDGLESTTVDANGHTTVTLRDARGEVVKTRRGVGTPEETTYRYVYEPFGALRHGTNLLSASVGQNGRELHWNEHGLLESSNDAETGYTSYTYNGLLDLETRTNANGDVWRIESRDASGRPVDTSVTGSTGLVRSRTHIDYAPAADVPVDKSPGAISQVIRTDFETAVGGVQTALEYFYDDLGRIKRQTYTMPGEVPRTADTLAVDYDYDSAGRLRHVTYPKLAGQSSAVAVEYRYDDLHDLSLREVVTYPGAELLWRVDTTDLQNRPDQFTTGDGAVETNHYTADGALDMVTVKAGSAAADPYLSVLNFNYDPVGNLKGRYRSAGPSMQLEEFSYDALNRLHGRQVYNQFDPIFNIPIGAPIAKRAYDYDKLGNRLGGQREYDALHPTRLTKDVNGMSLAYDAIGNVTHRATGLIADPVQDIAYNDMNLPSTITGAPGKVLARFLYGPHGEVLRTSRDTSQVDNVTTAFPGLYERVTPANSSPIVHRFKVKARGRDVAILSYDEARSTGTLSAKPTVFPHYDHLGSVDIATHRAPGAAVAEVKTLRSYDAFGRLRYTDWANDSTVILTNSSTRLGGYSGHEDEPNLSLVHMGGRVYDPIAERFLSVDPLAAPGTNGYSYASNNPTSRIDPNGFEDEGAGGWSPPLADPPPAPTGPNMSCWPGDCGSHGGESSNASVCGSSCRKAWREYHRREELRRRDAQMRAEHAAVNLGGAIDLHGSKAGGTAAPSTSQGTASAGINGGAPSGGRGLTDYDRMYCNHGCTPEKYEEGRRIWGQLNESLNTVTGYWMTIWSVPASLAGGAVVVGSAQKAALGGALAGWNNAAAQARNNNPTLDMRQVGASTVVGYGGTLLGGALMGGGGPFAWSKDAPLAENMFKFVAAQPFFLSYGTVSSSWLAYVNGSSPKAETERAAWDSGWGMTKALGLNVAGAYLEPLQPGQPANGAISTTLNVPWNLLMNQQFPQSTPK